MTSLSEESMRKLTAHITDLVRYEVEQESRLADRAKMPGAVLSQELVNTRAQLATLRWVPSVDRADWKARQNDVEKRQLVVQGQLDALTHVSDGPAHQAAHDLILSLHGQSSALNWALLVL